MKVFGSGRVSFVKAGIVVAMLALSAPVLADQIEVSGNVGNWKLTHSLNVDVDGSNVSGRAGEANLTNISLTTGTGPDSDLSLSSLSATSITSYMWCIEPNQVVGSSATWDLVNLEDAPVPGPAMHNADDLRLLFGNVYPAVPITGIGSGSIDIGFGSLTLSNQDFRDAFQLAIWEITQEQPAPVSGAFSYDLDSGNFEYNSGASVAAFNAAKSWLDALNDDSFDSTKMANNLYALAKTTNGGRYYQDFVVAVNPVPLPAAAWLFLSAIVGTGVVARRKRSADKTA